MDDNFYVLTEQDKKDTAYTACIAGTTVTGLAVGGFLGGVGAPVGAVSGFAWGLLSCRRLSPFIKRKFFSKIQPFQESEVVSMLQEIKSLHPWSSKKDALKMLAAIKAEIARNPDKYKTLA